MTHDTNIPQGYKATALGIIPQEWEVKRLGEICTYFKSGEGITSKDISENGQYPVYGGNGLRGYTDKKYTHDGAYILIGRQGALCGNINYVTGKCYISEHAIAVQTKGDLSWLRYKLDFWNLNRYSESSAQPGLSVEKLVRYKLTVPPLAEQRKIAEVLGVWDEAIEKQARLIEKLALRKRALMQRLLSAKLRLPGFSEPWEKVKLGDIGHFLSSNTLSRDCLNEQIGNIKNIHYGDILIKLPTIVDASFIHIPYVNDDVIVKSDYLKNGDIIFADTAEDYTVGKAIEIINIQAIPVTSGLHTIPFRPKSGIFVNRFLGYYVNSTDYRRQLQPLIQGIKVYSISKTALCKTTLKIPTLSEQTAIAEVLTAADREIELAKEKLERLRRQKRGLMQQLLTGKKRVKYGN